MTPEQEAALKAFAAIASEMTVCDDAFIALQARLITANSATDIAEAIEAAIIEPSHEGDTND